MFPLGRQQGIGTPGVPRHTTPQNPLKPAPPLQPRFFVSTAAAAVKEVTRTPPQRGLKKKHVFSHKTYFHQFFSPKNI